MGIALLVIARSILLSQPDSTLTYTVQPEDLVETIEVSGTYTTASQTPVNSPTSGIITEFFVSNGDHINKDDPLFHVESTASESEQKTARSNYLTALSALQAAKNTKESLDVTMWQKQQAYLDAQNTQNYKNDHTQNPATGNDYTEIEKFEINNKVVQTEKDFRAAEEAYKKADIALNAAYAKVATAKQSFDETQSTTVIAPATGTVTNLLAEVGDSARAIKPSASSLPDSLSAQDPQPILVVANLGNPHILANVSEDYAARISSGQKASIVFDSLKDQSFTGSVKSVATIGISDNGVISYLARITPSNLPSNIKPNMTALISIETLRKDNVFAVPNSAIIKKDEGAFVMLSSTRKLIPIEIGIKGTAKTEILNGVAPGTEIIANPDSEK